MATYKYRQEYYSFNVGDGVIKYNLTPDGGVAGPGTKITINGQVSGGTKALKSIGVALCGNGVDTMYAPYAMVAYVNKSIAKGATATFTISFTLTHAHWQMMKNARSAQYPGQAQVPFQPVFYIGTAVMNDSQVMNEAWGDSVTSYEQNNYFYSAPGTNDMYTMYVVTGNAPSVYAPTVSDEAPVSALTALGNIVTVHSLPRVTGSFAYDSRYPDQTGHVVLTLTGAMTGTYEKDVGSGVTTAFFDLPVPIQAGTVNLRYTVTDMFGKSTYYTSSFTVVAYAKPYITTCSFERYQEVQTDTGFEHEASPSGEYIWLNLDANIAAVNSRNAWTATLTAWRKERPEIAPTAGSAVYENTTGERRTVSTWALAGSDGQHIQLARDEDNLSDEMVLSAAFDWCLRLTLTDALGNSVTLLVDDDIRKDSAILDVGPYGVSVGARSTGAETDPLFECSYPAQFKGDVAVPASGLLKVVSTQLWADQSVASGSYLIDTYTVSAGDGWTPLGIVGYNISSHWIYVYDLRLQSATTVRCGVHNARSSAQTCSMTIRLLCVRTSL